MKVDDSKGDWVRPLLCGDCKNAYLGQAGVYCVQFNEFIMSEEIANECESYDE